jgi:hypothetical protein
MIAQILANKTAFAPSNHTVSNYLSLVFTIRSHKHRIGFMRICRAPPLKSLQQNTKMPMASSAMAIAVPKTPFDANIFLRISASAKGLGPSDQ